jgi:hypothetical protein
MTKTFKHSGDIGDIIYGLVTIKRLGGGTLYLDTTGGKGDRACGIQCLNGRTKFNKNGYDFLYPLIKAQPYITDVKEWNGENVDYNLNDYRIKFNDGTCKTSNIIDNQLDAFNLPLYTDHNESWLTVDNIMAVSREVVINRTARYHSNYSWYFVRKNKIAETAIFLGHPKEHEYFEYTFDISLPYCQTKNALEVAKILKNSKCLIANESAILAIAIGLGTIPIIQEVYPRTASCVFKNKTNMNYI